MDGANQETPTPLAVTKDLLRSWDACADGYRWFCEKFPHGGGFHEVNRALVTERRYDDSRWLADKAFAAAMASGSVRDAVKIAGADAEKIAADAKEIAASAIGDAATTGYGANAATTGDSANAATTGHGAVAACLGRYGKAMAGPDGCIVIGWWDDAANRPRVAVGYVGENGIRAGVWYRVESGQIVEAA